MVFGREGKDDRVLSLCFEGGRMSMYDGSHYRPSHQGVLSHGTS